MAVGLAAAEKHLAARFNKPDCELVDHYTYVVMGDGCNQEGISNEAASFAGHQGLGKLIALYDDNKITIDGHTDISFTEDVCARYEALGWHVQHVEDGQPPWLSCRQPSSFRGVGEWAGAQRFLESARNVDLEALDTPLQVIYVYFQFLHPALETKW